MEGGSVKKRKLSQDEPDTQPPSISRSISGNAVAFGGEETVATHDVRTQTMKRLKQGSVDGTTSPLEPTSALGASSSGLPEAAAVKDDLISVPASSSTQAELRMEPQNDDDVSDSGARVAAASTSLSVVDGFVRVAYASGDTADNPVYLVTSQAVAKALLANRLGIDHLHDFPYPEAIAAANAAAEKKKEKTEKKKKKKKRKNKQIPQPPPPPLLLRREEVYVAAKEGLLDEVLVAGRRVAAHEFVQAVDKSDTVLYLHHVFMHFWKKGLVISPATKFGGHFLLYMTDRDTEHVRAFNGVDDVCRGCVDVCVRVCVCCCVCFGEPSAFGRNAEKQTILD